MTPSLCAFLTPLHRLIQIIPRAKLTPEEKAWIAAHPVVHTYADTHWRPFEFRKRGKVVGVVPSCLDAISRIGGLRFEYVDNVSWANSYQALMSAKSDMAPGASRSADISQYRSGTICQPAVLRRHIGGGHTGTLDSLSSNAIRTLIVRSGRRSSLLQRSQLAPKQAGRADAAVAASESLLTLLDDVLEYSRLESRNVTLAPESDGTSTHGRSAAPT